VRQGLQRKPRRPNNIRKYNYCYLKSVQIEMAEELQRKARLPPNKNASIRIEALYNLQVESLLLKK
jgi:hypothetical protein